MSKARPVVKGGVRQAVPHDSAHKHVGGSARYVDDLPIPDGAVEVYPATSPHAHAEIRHMDLTAVAREPGVIAVLCAADIPGVNDASPICGDDPLLAEGVVEYLGQPLFLVVARSRDQGRAAALKARIDYRVLPAIIHMQAAMEAGIDVVAPRTILRGDPDAVMAAAPHTLTGRLRIGGQEHFYLEGQVALAIPGEDADMQIFCSSQHPSEVQHTVAKVLNISDNAVTTEVRRMGGAFGGKETQAAPFAAMAALAARKTGCPAKLVLDRDDDMIITGKRHDFCNDYRIGYDDSGRILAFEIEMASRCGRSADLSGAINDRAVYHVDNCYFLQHVRITSRRLKTHTASNTAFRGFGGPQGMMVIEHAMDAIACDLGMDPLEVRKRNLYGEQPRNTTPYGMTVEDNIAPLIIERLEAQSDYRMRRRAVEEYNASSPVLKKGLALTPVKFGISFTTTFLNQGGALVHVYTDGSVHLNHGGTEMGQGLNTKVAQVVAEEFQIDLDQIKISATRTDKVPNTSATAASAGTDINGKAAQAAALCIKTRLIDFAARHWQVPEEQVRFCADAVQVGERRMGFAELVQAAYLNRVSLSATGFYRTPKIHYDADSGCGRPFYYFAYGAAVSEVLVDTLTGEYRVTRVDILHDAGDSLNPAIDRGQIEGGFIQGMGWLTSEELLWNEQGELLTHAPSTYKIPTCGDRPEQMNIEILQDSPNRENAIYRSKAVGEPPLMLAISVFRALADAVSRAAGTGAMPVLDAPATPERVLMAIRKLRAESSPSPP